MSFTFKPAVRENAPVLIMLAGPSGGGKTKTALRLAQGLAGPNGKIAGIDTEAGRMTHYADQHKFDHGDLDWPFTPARYLEAIESADKAGYAVVIIDSASHEWAGTGGCLEMQEAELERMGGSDWAKRERVKMAAWIKPKMEHKKMMSRLLQCRAHIIMCFRAEEKVEIRKDSQGKQMIVPIGFQPICEKNMPYEATVSFLLSDTKTHLPTPIKLQDQHKPFFPLDKPIGEDCGVKLAAWAKGGAPKPPAVTPAVKPNGVAPAPSADAPTFEADFMPQDNNELGSRQADIGVLQPRPTLQFRKVDGETDPEYDRAEAQARAYIVKILAATDPARITESLVNNKDRIEAWPLDIKTVVYEQAAKRKAALGT